MSTASKRLQRGGETSNSHSDSNTSTGMRVANSSRGAAEGDTREGEISDDSEWGMLQENRQEYVPPRKRKKVKKMSYPQRVVENGKRAAAKKEEEEEDEFFQQLVWQTIQEDKHEFESPQRKEKQTRASAKRPKDFDFNDTKWGMLYHHENTINPSTKEGKVFRRRFRVPFRLFRDTLVPLCEQHSMFRDAPNHKIPVYIKTMAALRVLGRGNCADDISEMSGVGESTINVIFKEFLQGMVDHVFDKVVKPPTGKRLENVLKTYSLLGLPGCIGSMDCTHVAWGQCPQHLQQDCRGKEGFPTLSFEVIVDHARTVLHCTKAFGGRTNDINISKMDPFCDDLVKGKGPYKNVKFEMMDDNGIKRLYLGAWLLVDGGYLKIGCYIDPKKDKFYRDEVLFSEWLESVRKDVECTFGMIKSRFRFLWGKVMHRDHEVIQNAFQTACILHNLIIQYDGKALEDWQNTDWEHLGPEIDDRDEDGDEDVEQLGPNKIQGGDQNVQDDENEDEYVDWGTLDPNGKQDGDYINVEAFRYIDEKKQNEREQEGRIERKTEVRNERQIVKERKARAMLIRNATEPCIDELELEVVELGSYEEHYDILSKGLSVNYQQLWRRGMVCWPKGHPGDRGTLPPVDERAKVQYYACLYEKASIWKVNNISIGKGLFSRLNYCDGDTITYFNGIKISPEEYEKNEKEGYGGYGIVIDEKMILDCYDKNKEGKCMASFANCPKGCVTEETVRVQRGDILHNEVAKVKAKANAKIVVSAKHETAKLVCIVPHLPANTEILCTYQDSYKYPV
jgi:hypothetical protein